ncbi:MAG: class I SAM-dependent methyltransferase [Nanoarchaeota archaeon]
MVDTINRRQIEKTKSLAEAVKLVYGINLKGRLCVLDNEAMVGEVADSYNELGLNARRETYRKLAQDFKFRTDYFEGKGIHKHILDVGCGSGLLSYEIAEQTDAFVVGLDVSQEMIELANKNKEKISEEKVKKIISDYEGEYNLSKSLPASCDPMPEIVDVGYNPSRRTTFVQGSVYDLSELVGKNQHIDYIVCRNVLHRFQNSEEAIRQMFYVLGNQGKLYIRDLRRDTDWKTVVERIGDERWKHPELVIDYIGAMAAMFTSEELSNMLNKIGVNKFEISDGSYRTSGPNNLRFKEFEKETEYVCVIEK